MESNLPKGVEFRLGIPSKGGSRVQSVLFAMDKWRVGEAKQWLKDHAFQSHRMEVPAKGKFLHFPQEAPEKFRAIRTMRNPRRSSSESNRLLTLIKDLEILLDTMREDVHSGEVSERAITDAIHDVKRAIEIVRGEG